MAGIFERITSLAGTEAAKAINLAHEHFQLRMGHHGHTGRALVETVAEVCRNHPNLVGIGVGLLVEQFLVEEKHRHDAHLKAEAEHPGLAVVPHDDENLPATVHAAPAVPAHTPLHSPFGNVKIHNIRPGHIAFEVFGGLLVLKMGALGSAIFRKDHHAATWLADVSRIHIFSATFAAYYMAKAIRSPKISSWRNAAIALFATDAIKPLLQMDPKRRKALAAAQAHR